VAIASLSFLGVIKAEEDCVPQPCENLWKRCDNGKWDKDDCSTPDVFNNCPLLCDNCPPCKPAKEKEEQINGGFSDWVKIVSCRKDCFEGDLEIHERTCDNPEPQGGGKYCEGKHFKIKECEGCKNAASQFDNIIEQIDSLSESFVAIQEETVSVSESIVNITEGCACARGEEEEEEEKEDPNGSLSSLGMIGYKKMFRYPYGAGVHIQDYYLNGITDPTQDRSSYTAPSVKLEDMYRPEDLQTQIQNAKQIVMVVYAEDGSTVDALTFNPSGDMTSWFGRNNLVSTQFWNILSSSQQFFTMEGEGVWGRYWFIEYNYAGCRGDNGWFITECMQDNGEWPCEWNDIGLGVEEPRQYICAIWYSPQEGYQNWYYKTYKRASAIELHIS